MSKGDTFENDLLKLIFNATAIANIADNAASSPLTSLYVALHTADPGDAGNQGTSEISYTGYARVAVARTTGGWTASSAGSTSPVATIVFRSDDGRHRRHCHLCQHWRCRLRGDQNPVLRRGHAEHHRRQRRDSTAWHRQHRYGGLSDAEGHGIATMSASSRMGGGLSLAAQIEAAMVEAIKQAQAEGITDQDEIRARMLAAREAVKNPPQE
jgi:hypothetical protein